jgi:hypothetical protein
MQADTEMLSYHKNPVHYFLIFRDISIRKAEKSLSIISVWQSKLCSPSLIPATQKQWLHIGITLKKKRDSVNTTLQGPKGSLDK